MSTLIRCDCCGKGLNYKNWNKYGKLSIKGNSFDICDECEEMLEKVLAEGGIKNAAEEVQRNE